MFPYLFPLESPSLPPSLSHPSRRSQSTELISLCYAAASHLRLLILLHSLEFFWQKTSALSPNGKVIIVPALFFFSVKSTFLRTTFTFIHRPYNDRLSTFICVLLILSSSTIQAFYTMGYLCSSPWIWTAWSIQPRGRTPSFCPDT